MPRDAAKTSDHKRDNPTPSRPLISFSLSLRGYWGGVPGSCNIHHVTDYTGNLGADRSKPYQRLVPEKQWKPSHKGSLPTLYRYERTRI